MRKTLGSILLSGLAAGTACSSGGGGDDGGPICVDFDAAAAAAAGRATAAEGSGSDCNTVVVELSLTDIADVFTVSFGASFDTDLVRYEGYSISGSHLASDGATVEVLENAGSGEVLLGVGRLGATTGVNFVGTQRVVRLTFSRASGVGDGDDGALSFSNTEVFDGGAPSLEIPGITWFGGTFRARN